MEFVKVNFPTVRQVFIDGEEEGAVGDLIRVQRGLHTFDLGSPPDYTPPTQDVNVIGTTATSPREIDFEPAMALVHAARAEARRRLTVTPAASRTATTKTTGRTATKKKRGRRVPKLSKRATKK